MLASSAPYVAVIDADMQHDERLLPQMLERLKSGDEDLVNASRYLEGGSTGELAAHRVGASRLATFFGRSLAGGITDPMSGFFMVRRRFLERVVRRLYGRGFKILLDLIAAARGEVRIGEVPYHMRSRQRGESKLGLRVVAEFFMLLLYHLFGRLLPARFFLFCAVGVTGVGVHLAVLTAAFRASGGQFLASQALATLAAMTSNFFLNNVFTYADQRVRGRQVWRALVSFYLACGIGSIVNLAVAEWLYLHSGAYWLAGIVGALTAAFWNFFTTASFTWGAAARTRE
jgi:dolichol-phosphate mannosyltransferase